MQVTLWVNRNISVQVEGSTDKELFENLAKAQKHEFFQDTTCGKCGSEDIKFQVRTVKDEETKEENNFHELVCKKCYAKLSFGHAKVGGAMYAKRLETGAKGKAIKDEAGKGKPLADKGWLRYNKETGKNE